jgi:protein phosphatase
MSYCFKTDIGKMRDKNEDSGDIFVNKDGDVFLAVLDGMGGHASGKTASHLALKELKERILKKDKFRTNIGMKMHIMRAIRAANNLVNEMGNASIEYRDMGTTLIFAALHKGKLSVFNIGDSRCYSIENDVLEQLSEDQTYVQFLYKTGKISKDQMATHPKRHVLMNALGTYPSVTVVEKTYKRHFTQILLCSDGLYNMVEDNDIENVLKSTSKSTDEKVDTLISLANENGGKDNIAIALWEDK